MDRYIGEWLYYNFVPLEIFTHTNFVPDFIQLRLNFIFKPKNRFWATLWRLRGNVRTRSTTRWKARGRLSIHHNWTFFAVSYSWDARSRNLSKSPFIEGASHYERKFQTERASPTNTVGVRKQEWLPLRVVSKYPPCIVWFCYKARMWQTNKQTDRRTELQPR